MSRSHEVNLTVLNWVMISCHRVLRSCFRMVCTRRGLEVRYSMVVRSGRPIESMVPLDRYSDE
jgi:hypothetical protein